MRITGLIYAVSKKHHRRERLNILDMWLLKLDSTGNRLWNQTYGGSSDDEGMPVTQTPNGDIAIAGLTYSCDQTDVNGLTCFVDFKLLTEVTS